MKIVCATCHKCFDACATVSCAVLGVIAQSLDTSRTRSGCALAKSFVSLRSEHETTLGTC